MSTPPAKKAAAKSGAGPAAPSGPLHEAYRRYLGAVVLFHQAAAESTGLGSTDFQALNLLDLHGSMRSGELARWTGLSTGATTRLIDRLESAGLVRRAADPSDRRKVLVEPTGLRPDGLMQAIAPARREIAEVFDGLDEHQLAGMLAYFTGASDAYQGALGELRGQGA
jgi:DNA-binding MarR family transcriptional regulator